MLYVIFPLCTSHQTCCARTIGAKMVALAHRTPTDMLVNVRWPTQELIAKQVQPIVVLSCGKMERLFLSSNCFQVCVENGLWRRCGQIFFFFFYCIVNTGEKFQLCADKIGSFLWLVCCHVVDVLSSTRSDRITTEAQLWRLFLYTTVAHNCMDFCQLFLQ